MANAGVTCGWIGIALSIVVWVAVIIWFVLIVGVLSAATMHP